MAGLKHSIFQQFQVRVISSWNNHMMQKLVSNSFNISKNLISASMHMNWNLNSLLFLKSEFWKLVSKWKCRIQDLKGVCKVCINTCPCYSKKAAIQRNLNLHGIHFFSFSNFNPTRINRELIKLKKQCKKVHKKEHINSVNNI